MKKLILIVVTVLLLASCQPSESAIQTAMAETQAAWTPTPSSTPTFLPTSTSTPSPTPDIRVIDINPEDIILLKAELPQDGKYRLVYSNPSRNSEVMAARTVEEGQIYLEKTGRVDGWVIEYDKSTTTVRVPEYVLIQAVLFKTSQGPTYIYNEDSMRTGHCPEDKTLVDEDMGLADWSYLCQVRTMQSSGEYYLQYELDMGYRNVFVAIYVGGNEGSYDLSWLKALAQTQVDKLASLPLSDKVLFEP